MIFIKMSNSGFLKWGYPQSSSIFLWDFPSTPSDVLFPWLLFSGNFDGKSDPPRGTRPSAIASNWGLTAAWIALGQYGDPLVTCWWPNDQQILGFILDPIHSEWARKSPSYKLIKPHFFRTRNTSYLQNRLSHQAEMALEVAIWSMW